MTDMIASEWIKLHTVRSTYALLAAAFVALGAGAAAMLLLVASYDAASAADRATFEAADPTVVVMPFVAFFVGSVGALAITSEYSTGMIRASLVAVPRRLTFLGGKAVVVAAVTFVAGQLYAFGAFLVATLILGNRPAPINPWPSFGAALPSVVGSGLTALVAGLLALGIGVVVRSGVVTLAATGGLLLVAPIFAHFLPAPWHLRVASVLPPNLAPQLAGADTAYVLSPPAAAAVMLGYIAVALTAAALTLCRRDA